MRWRAASTNSAGERQRVRRWARSISIHDVKQPGFVARMSEAISGPLGGAPACRFAHAGYKISSLFICITPFCSSFFFPRPDEGRAERRQAPGCCVHPDACMTARGLSLVRGESPASELPDATPLGAPSWRFLDPAQHFVFVLS